MTTYKIFTRLAVLSLGLALAATACSNSDAQPEPIFDPADPAEQTFDPIAAAEAGDLTLALEAIVAETGVPALGAAVFTSDGPLDIGVAGLRKRGGSSPVTEDDVFHIGSNTKAMTAALLGLTAQHGRGVSFDTTLAEAFSGSIHADYADVTMGDLLAHTGGVPADAPDVDESLSITEQRAAVARMVIGSAPDSEPKTQSRYSNAGYIIVGAALEAATGTSWEDLLATELFEPLGMSSCGFGAPGDGSGDDAPLGHLSGKPVHLDNPAVMGPAGTVYCSMADWGSFLTEILRGYRADSDLFDRETVDLLLATHDEPVENGGGARAGRGWLRIDGGPDGPVYWHNGSNTFWLSQAVLVPDIDIAAVSVSNEFSTGDPATHLALATITEMYPGSGHSRS
jgi:CubicO group peptidase (beta-lactamase class C family)